jgi:mannose-6-phosphate isomerase-like protein (cupin superfamily)
MHLYDVSEITGRSDDFRREIVTGPRSQLVVMTLRPGEEIGEEVHEGDQLLHFIAGEAEAIVEGETSLVSPGQLVFVPAGARHNFRNAGDEPVRLLTVYAPPEHEPGTVHATKAEADAAEHH